MNSYSLVVQQLCPGLYYLYSSIISILRNSVVTFRQLKTSTRTFVATSYQDCTC